MYHRIAAFLLLASLTSCGEKDAYIADHVNFRVFFSKQAAQISFDLNKQYEITETLEADFNHQGINLGEIFLDYDSEEQHSAIGSYIGASSIHQTTIWPTTWISRFPNGKKLPESVPDGSAQEWKLIVPGQNLEPRMIFRFDPNLIVAGALLSPQFNAVGEDFLATQHFRAANGDVEATISVAGPSNGSKGGVYFFGNFGVNPFTTRGAQPQTSDLQNNEKENSMNAFDREEREREGDVVVWTLEATEPARIITPGRRWWQWFSLSETFKAFNSEIQSLHDNLPPPAN